jgi:tetratricopeptide (TPR) repeat protein
MNELSLAELHHLQAAEGWLELGSPLEAEGELEQIAPHRQAHPAVLAARWQLDATAGRWDRAYQIAGTLTELAAEDISSWVWRAYALRRMPGGGIEPARELLLGVVEKFPREWTICYNLACYACQLGNPEEARGWLAKAFARGEARALKRMALDDPDLEPLRATLEQL